MEHPQGFAWDDELHMATDYRQPIGGWTAISWSISDGLDCLADLFPHQQLHTEIDAVQVSQFCSCFS
jgi:hypothetical protein